jgi:hypothetical protein
MVVVEAVEAVEAVAAVAAVVGRGGNGCMSRGGVHLCAISRGL